jgi:hypothetical protein
LLAMIEKCGNVEKMIPRQDGGAARETQLTFEKADFVVHDKLILNFYCLRKHNTAGKTLSIRTREIATQSEMNNIKMTQ